MTLVIHDSSGPPALAAAARTPDRIRGIVGVNTFGWKPAGRLFCGMLALMGSPTMRRIDVATGVLARVTATTFGVGRHLDEASRRAYRAGLTRSMGAFHDYLGQARFSDQTYDEVTRALTGPFRRLPLLIFSRTKRPRLSTPMETAFPERPAGRSERQSFSDVRRPDFVAETIRSWRHRPTSGRHHDDERAVQSTDPIRDSASPSRYETSGRRLPGPDRVSSRNPTVLHLAKHHSISAGADAPGPDLVGMGQPGNRRRTPIGSPITHAISMRGSRP